MLTKTVTLFNFCNAFDILIFRTEKIGTNGPKFFFKYNESIEEVMQAIHF